MSSLDPPDPMNAELEAPRREWPSSPEERRCQELAAAHSGAVKHDAATLVPLVQRLKADAPPDRDLENALGEVAWSLETLPFDDIVGGALCTFFHRWLEVAPADHPDRPLVAKLADKLWADEVGGYQVAKAAEVVRAYPKFHRHGVQPQLVSRRTGPQIIVARSRESRTPSVRRARSSASRDGPSRSDDDDPDDADRVARSRGQLGVVREKERR